MEPTQTPNPTPSQVPPQNTYSPEPKGSHTGLVVTIIVILILVVVALFYGLYQGGIIMTNEAVEQATTSAQNEIMMDQNIDEMEGSTTSENTSADEPTSITDIEAEFNSLNTAELDQ